MALYQTLKAAIVADIRDNVSQDITGNLLQSNLIEIVDALAAGYLFMGVATPATNPGSPDERVAYLAGPGTYPHFGVLGITVPSGSLGVLLWDNSWTLKTIAIPDPTSVDVTGMVDTGNQLMPAVVTSLQTALAIYSGAQKYIRNDVLAKEEDIVGMLISQGASFIGGVWTAGAQWSDTGALDSTSCVALISDGSRWFLYSVDI